MLGMQPADGVRVGGFYATSLEVTHTNPVDSPLARTLLSVCTLLQRGEDVVLAGQPLFSDSSALSRFLAK